MLPIELIHLVCAHLDWRSIARWALILSPVTRKRLLRYFQVKQVGDTDIERGLNTLANSYFFRHDPKLPTLTPLTHISDIYFRHVNGWGAADHVTDVFGRLYARKYNYPVALDGLGPLHPCHLIAKEVSTLQSMLVVLDYEGNIYLGNKCYAVQAHRLLPATNEGIAFADIHNECFYLTKDGTISDLSRVGIHLGFHSCSDVAIEVDNSSTHYRIVYVLLPSGRLNRNSSFQEGVRKVVWSQGSSYCYINIHNELVMVDDCYYNQPKTVFVSKVLDAAVVCGCLYVLKLGKVYSGSFWDKCVKPLCSVPDNIQHLSVEQMDPFTNIIHLW